MPSAASRSAAFSASATIRPMAMMATSPPSRMMFAFPGTKGVLSSVKHSHTGRATRIYTGPSMAAAARTALRTSTASQGTKIVILGITRIRAMSSMLWWLPPSSPTHRPEWEKPNFTLAFTYAMELRICS